MAMDIKQRSVQVNGDKTQARRAKENGINMVKENQRHNFWESIKAYIAYEDCEDPCRVHAKDTNGQDW